MLAPELVEKCKKELDILRQFKAKKVPKHMIYKFLIKNVLSEVNYAAFIDEDQAQEDYKKIDVLIAELLKELFESDKSISDTINNLCDPVETGG